MILSGLLLKLQVSVRTDAIWLLKMTSASSIHLRIWDLLQSRTSQFFIQNVFLKTSANMLRRFLLILLQSSMRTMMLCVLSGVMTIQSAAAFLQHRQERKCSSLVLAQTLQRHYFTLSTAERTKVQVLHRMYRSDRNLLRLLLNILITMKLCASTMLCLNGLQNFM